jgi:hypothetical protein
VDASPRRHKFPVRLGTFRSRSEHDVRHASHNRFLRPDHVGNCRRIVVPALTCIQGFSTAIQQQIVAIYRGPPLIEVVAKKIVYPQAKTAYFNA